MTVRNSFQLSIAVSLLVHMAVLVLLSSITPREAGRPRAYFVDIVEEKPPPVERPLPLLKEVAIPLKKPLPYPEEKPRPESMFGEDEVTEIPPRVAKEDEEDLSPSGEAEEKGKGEEPVTPEGLARGEGLKKLFDAEVIQEFARKEPLEEEGGGITFSMEELKLLNYNKFLSYEFDKSWEIPREAFDKGLSGLTILQLVINKNGTLGGLKLVESSGYKILDDAALEAVKNAAPFLPLPESWERDSYTTYWGFILIGSDFVIFVY